MCGRYGIEKAPDLEEYFQLPFGSLRNLENKDVRPTNVMPVIVEQNGTRQTPFMRWGLIPAWSTDGKTKLSMFNARLEKLDIGTVYKPLLKSHRCIVPMSYFYEWSHEDIKTKYRINLKAGQPLGLAGLWTTWNRGEQTIDSYTIITTNANSQLKNVHDRMPVILTIEQQEEWLTGEPYKLIEEMRANAPRQNLVVTPETSTAKVGLDSK